MHVYKSNYIWVFSFVCLGQWCLPSCDTAQIHGQGAYLPQVNPHHSSKLSMSKPKLIISPKTWFLTCVANSVITFPITSGSKSFSHLWIFFLTPHNKCDHLFCCSNLDLWVWKETVSNYTRKTGVPGKPGHMVDLFIIHWWPGSVISTSNDVSSANASDLTSFPTFKLHPTSFLVMHCCHGDLPTA